MSKNKVAGRWVSCDMTEIFSLESLQHMSEDIQCEPRGERLARKCVVFPDFGANLLEPTALTHLCAELGANIRQAVSIVNDIPSVIIASRMCSVWDRVLNACSNELYSTTNVNHVLTVMQKEDKIETSDPAKKIVSQKSSERLTGNAILMEMGIKTGLTMVFSLLKQSWLQLAWQKQLEKTLLQPGELSFGPSPALNLPNEVLKSVLDVLAVIPPLSLSNPKTISNLSQTCLKLSMEFLQWVISSNSIVDMEGKRLALQIMLSLSVQYGSLVQLLDCTENVLELLTCYQNMSDSVSQPSLEANFCLSILKKIRVRTQLGPRSSSTGEDASLFPLDETGHVSVIDFLDKLFKELSKISECCTTYFNQENSGGRSDFFLSETCEVYAFGSNSSSQLAMGALDKFQAATIVPHMADAQVVAAGHYCSFLVYADGSVYACGKGSYGRLGLGNNDMQTSLKHISTFPSGTKIRTITTSKGSDGHSLALTAEGQVYSWGDANYWKLGHGDNITQKTPKLIAALQGKVVRSVACGNKHSAAVTVEGDLYTWGEGEYGRLGHGNCISCKIPTKVQAIGPVKQVACGVSHTLVLSMDSMTVWSFGSGDLGKLGHGDTTKQTLPKAIAALQGIMCQKICAANQFSLVLSIGGKVYSFGNGSGVGRGSTEPRQLTPSVIERLEEEMVIDISTGDGHCLALTQRGELYSWGTNSMGQCGQGHSNGSILTPSKVVGLDGVQVQQISAGTSHSVVWTAVPCNRQASALWHWPYCISVGENTFVKLLSLLNKFGHFHSKEPLYPFSTIELQESFVLSLLSLLRTHLSLVAPIGPSCVHMACGSSVKPLRDLLFNLVDSQLPPLLDKETSAALEVGSSVLLPPVCDRLELLLSILPEDPASITTLSTGQLRQLTVLLRGFSDRGEFVGVFIDEVVKFIDLIYDNIDLSFVDKILYLNHRMIQYIYKATLSCLHDEPLPQKIHLGSPLLKSFQEFITSTFIHVIDVMWFILDGIDPSEYQSLPINAKKILMHHTANFRHLLRDTFPSILKAMREAAINSGDPAQFLLSKQDVLFGFLAFQYPCHMALSFSEMPVLDRLCGLGDLLLEVAKSVHQLIILLPDHIILQLEKEELLFEHKGGEFDLLTLHGPCEQPWRKLMDYERLLCYCSAKLIHQAYFTAPITEHNVLEYTPFIPGKGRVNKTNLLNSHLLRNGAVGGEKDISQALYVWVSLCKNLPGEPTLVPNVAEEDSPTIATWSSYLTDYELLKTKKDNYSNTTHQILDQEASNIEPLDASTAPVLHSLAVGGLGNEQAESMYRNMMDYALHRDWNTSSDEDAVPELKLVSCAALACLLKHTGLSSSASCNSSFKPKKRLVDVYRHVFSLRREVFTHRPIPDSEGKISSEDKEKFTLQCNGMCVTLMLLMCILEPAIPEENDPIILPKERSDDSFESVGSQPPRSVVQKVGSTHKHPVRLLSYPRIEDTASKSSTEEEKIKIPAILHSSSLTQTPLESHQDISLSGVKQTLSLLRWHRDRLDHLEASSTSGCEGSPHFIMCSTIIDVVSQVFCLDNSNIPSGKKGELKLLHRVDLIKALLDHQRRAENRLQCLNSVLQFIRTCNLLPSSQLIFKGTCLKHDIHYSDHITVAPSVLQHQVKALSHELFQLIVDKLLVVTTEDLLQLSGSNEPTLSQLSLERELLLAIQWINFDHQATDLQFFFTEKLYNKIAELSGVPSTEVSVLPSLPSTRLWNTLKLSCALVMRLLAMKVGLNAEILKTTPHILEVLSRHLLGQLQCFVAVDDAEIMDLWKTNGYYLVEKGETLLGDFLRFLNTLSATHMAFRSVMVSDHWFRTLLKIVDIDVSTGTSVVNSLKTRLLALQVLGTIMSEHTDNSVEALAKCTKVIEDLLELMFRCMYIAPVASLQHTLSKTVVSPDRDPAEDQTKNLPFLIDPNHVKSLQYTPDECGGVTVIYNSSSTGYFIGQTPLTCGKYSWKISIVSAPKSPDFVVGVSKKPFTDPFLDTDSFLETSGDIWVISYRGSVFHFGETDYCMMFTLREGSSIKLQYDVTKSQGALLCDYGHGYKSVLSGIAESGSPVYPVLIFPEDESSESSHVTLHFHPIHHIKPSLVTDLCCREQLASGYPYLSPTNTTLSQAIVSLLYQLQDKEHWSRSIGEVVINRLTELESLIHCLLNIEEQLSVSDGVQTDHGLISSLSFLMSKLTQTVWPALAVIGGLDSGFCLGRLCKLNGEEGKEEEEKEVLITSIPDFELNVVVQEKVTTHTAQIVTKTVSLHNLSLISQTKFSLPLIVDHLSPSMLLNLTHLAGFLDQHSIPLIIKQVHSGHSTANKGFIECLPYHLMCHSILQVAASKSLYAIMFDNSIFQLLAYQSPSLEAVVEGVCEDKSELAAAVQDVLKCLSSRAIKPSPLKPSIRLLELQKLHSMLYHESLMLLTGHMSSSAPLSERMLVKTPSIQMHDNVHQAPSDMSLELHTAIGSVSSHSSVSYWDGSDVFERGGAEAARSSTPLLVTMLMDMGFSRVQINVAMDKCVIPESTDDQAKMQLIVSWIIDHPNAVVEEEARLEQLRVNQEAEAEQRQREERLVQRQQAHQTAAADEFLSLVGEMLDPCVSPGSSDEEEAGGQTKSRTKHAPDLLEGPDIYEEVPDIKLNGIDTSASSLRSLLSALGISQKRPTPQKFEFVKPDPMGEELFKTDINEAKMGESMRHATADVMMTSPNVELFEISSSCNDLMSQVQKLKSIDESMAALDRIAGGTQTLVARYITMMVIASLSTTQPSKNFTTNLKQLDLLNIRSLVRLLRLVHAGRINGTPGDSFVIVTPSSLYPVQAVECLSNSITTIVVDEEISAGAQLMQSCSRDLFAAAVGGAELMQQSGRRRRHRRQRRSGSRLKSFDDSKSDVSILSYPNFDVSRRLVQTLARSTGRLTAGGVCSDGVLQMTDALAACLFSSKLQHKHQFWALEQLIKAFAAVSGGGIRKDQSSRSQLKDLLVPSKLEHLTGHKGQIMACVENTKEKKTLTIGEDNCVLLWDIQSGSSPEITVYPFPSTSFLHSTQGLLLPILSQSWNQSCVAGALNDTLCVWKVKDGKSVTQTFSELITALQFKPLQKEGEPPLLLVGLIDGSISIAEVLKTGPDLTSELQLTTMTRSIQGAVCCLSWSPIGAEFAVGSSSGCVKVFRGAGRGYVSVSEIKDSQVSYLCWSPDCHYLTVLDVYGQLQLWSYLATNSSISMAHSFNAYPTNAIQWHSDIAKDGSMLLASGARDGTVHLWLVTGIVEVSHLTSLEGHSAPITRLVFSETSSLLATSCKAGSVRIWDLSTFELLKYATEVVDEVIDINWTVEGLAICYKNTSSLCLLAPGPEYYLGERSLHKCLPMLNQYSITDPSKTPCLTAFLKNLHHILLDQYQYEQTELTLSQQLVHSEYLQLLTALAIGLGLHTILISPPHPPHIPSPPTPKEWAWLAAFNNTLNMAESLSKRTPLPEDCGFVLPSSMKSIDPLEKYQPTANSVWTLQMDTEILEWISQKPEDWWSSSHSSVYTWGKGSWNQLGHSTSENSPPALVAEWKDMQQVVAGSYCTYAVKFDSTVCSIGEGSYGRLGHGGSENETSMRIISALQGIPVVHIIAGPRVSTSTDEGFALALTDTGDVYSWGKGYKGRLGHHLSENVRSPKLIDALVSFDVKMIASCDYHCAVITENGRVFTFGSKENGKLGHGRDLPPGSIGHVTEVKKFYGTDEQREIPNVKIGYISCGQMFTLAITEDGTQVFAWGKADNCAFGLRDMTGDHHHPVLLAHLSPMGPFTKAVSGNRSASLLTTDGKVCTFGKLYDGLSQGVSAEFMEFPNEAKIIDLATAASYTLALTENGDVYYWGRNQYGTSTATAQTTPKLLQGLSGKGLKQISAAVRHCVASDTTPPLKGVSNITVPPAVPVHYSSLRDVSCEAIYGRLMLLNYFSKLVSSTWALCSIVNKNKADMTRFHLNPLSDGSTRSLFSPLTVEGMVAGVVSRTMMRKSHGPTITIQRIITDSQHPCSSDRGSKPIYPQVAVQILQKPAIELRCPSRAWKVKLVGEGADDAGGVFDETIAQMCEELETGVVLKLLIPTPNSTNKCGFNTDRYVLDPRATVARDYKYLKFLGILFGVAMRTKKPLDLHLARPMWKLLAGMNMTHDDLEEVDLMFIQMLYGIRDAHKNGIKEEDFSEMIPIESFEVQSMSGKFVPIVPGGSSTKLTFHNRKEYVEKALHFRLHELDEQVTVIREGMSCIVPVPLLSLYTAKMLEHAVCGREEVDLSMLKKVVRYRDGTSENQDVIQWLWQTLESFPNEEKILFLRFVSGRSRLPVRISDIPQRFQISVYGQSSESLPTAQTCFFQLRLPSYSSQEVLCERLRYAIRNCRSIDMDNYMLHRSGSSDIYDSDDDEDEEDDLYD